ncbi:helix-turn-helix transcriptional regulator [Pedobacter sp. MC2016-14]|uniref:helix-turn-helix domain-containing protein n=1 Tax=Pedobacter sp. MC2016-14 TaxID=2897327 RepID=UPI001E3788F9|nr:helix-turn-helix transcriptional regulator [Pedobacter sp. MC2016-14]MCD0489312.1 helix-turn-helix transcriptional regulator [Pedobacter sp. MC2016-14]
MKLITSKLKELRRCNNFKQIQIATQLQCSVASYCKMEKGTVDISYTKLKRLSEIYGVKLHELFLDNADPKDDTKTFISLQQIKISGLQNEIVILQNKLIHLYEEFRN